jgi:NAD-dependent dihydropyrimidine dehydrogenase PreA subunit
MPPEIDYEKCNACGRCVEICREDVFFSTKQGEKPIISHPEVCNHYGSCVLECPVAGAIRIRTPLAYFIPYK